MIAILLEKEVISHAGDVVADHSVARNAASSLLVIRRHGVALGEEKVKKPLEARNGVVAVFGDNRMSIQMGDEELFEAGILRDKLIAQTGEPLRVAANLFD